MKITKELHSSFEDKNRIGISLLKLQRLLIGRDIEHAVNSIITQIDKKPIGIRRTIIQNFEYLKKERELHFSSLVEIPINIKELIVEEKENKINKRVEYDPRNVQSIINIDNSSMIVFSQSQKEVKEFTYYLRELTAMRFNPIRNKIEPEKFQKIIKKFEIINQLKMIIGMQKSLKFINFYGDDIMNYPIVKDILTDDKNDIIEISGLIAFSNGKRIKLHINNQGRIWIYANAKNVDIEELYDFIRGFVNMLLEDDGNEQ